MSRPSCSLCGSECQKLEGVVLYGETVCRTRRICCRFHHAGFSSPANTLTIPVSKVVTETARLGKAEDSVEREVAVLEQKLKEKNSYLAHLRRQRESVIKTGHEMVRRGFKCLDELEEADLEESEAAVDSHSPECFGLEVWNAFFGIATKERASQDSNHTTKTAEGSST